MNIGTAIACVLAAGVASFSVSEAARHYRHSKAPVYGAYYDEGRTPSPCVTVMRDHQAADDGGHNPDRFIAMQTTADVGCGSSRAAPAYGQAANYPSAADLYLKYPRYMTIAAPPQHRQVKVITRTITVQ